MISDLVFRKKIGIPYISIILITSCLLVSIPTYFSSKYYFVFGGTSTPMYPWQNIITSQFEHGSYHGEVMGVGVPLLTHLIGNVLVILIFGSVTERIVGTNKFFIISITAGIGTFILSNIFKLYGNGASGIAWAYGPIMFIILLQLYKKNKRLLIKDFLFYVSIFLLLMMWIIISFIGGKSTIIFHTISTIIGILFVFLWKDEIANRVDGIIDENDDNKITNKKIAILSISLPVFILIILILSRIGVIFGY